MPSTLSNLQSAAGNLTPASAPEQVQALLDIGVAFLVEMLTMRGQTIEEWRAFRKTVIEQETAFIDAELAAIQAQIERP